jgi:type I restriction enzyme M protein
MSEQLEFTLSKDDELLKRFEEIHDFIYSNDGLSAQQALEEFVKILFVKILAENNGDSAFAITGGEWENIKNKNTPESENSRVAFLTRFNSLFEKTKQTHNALFDADDRIRLSVLSLAFAVKTLQETSLLKSSSDAKGLAFQKFLSHHEKDGNGQFFTPPPVIDFCVSLLQPSENETIIDPACGSGGFLFSTLNFLHDKNPSFGKQKFITQNLFGADINKSVSRIAKMKLILEGGDAVNILCMNSLSAIEELPFSNAGKFDAVLANPPFGAKITTPSVLQNFELGHKWARSGNSKEFSKTTALQHTQTTEVLFIERCLQLLREGGRMGIVLPNGNFENPSLEYLRYYIKLKAKILAVVNLPQETFIPFGTGVKTSLLFLEKDTKNAIRKYPVFFGRVTKLGYQGNKNGTPLYKKDERGNVRRDKCGSPILDEDFSDLATNYRKFQNGEKVEEPNAFSIDYNELNGRFDFDFYSPENRKIFNIIDGSRTAKLGEICEIVKTKSPKLKNVELEVEYIELSDINTHANEIINSTTYRVHELPSRASYELACGDILTAIAGNSVGTKKHATALVTNGYAGAICTNGFRVLRNFKEDPFFLLYFFRTELFLRQMFMYRTGAAIPNVSDEDLQNIIVSFPSNDRCQRIQKTMQHAFALREQAQHQVENMLEPKSALEISATVSSAFDKQ